MAENGPNPQATNSSTGELMKQLSEQTSTLVRQEIDLAKAELTEKGKAAGVGGGMLGGAGIIAFVALLTFTAFLVMALDTAMPGWLAALIVTLVYGAIAGVLALKGRDKVKEGGPPVPEQTVETVKEDVQWAKDQAKSVRK